jgi:hypothetical protein
MTERDPPMLTLEPLVDAVRAGMDGVGWTLSGLQKTTSHEFEGRWKGDSTRSAYLFFHRDDREEPVSIDVYLDETSRGLTGNLALVVDLVAAGVAPPVEALLARLAELSSRHLPPGYRTPLSLRFRLPDGNVTPGDAESEVRFKIQIPKAAIARGAGVVEALTGTVAHAFERLLAAEELRELLEES